MNPTRRMFSGNDNADKENKIELPSNLMGGEFSKTRPSFTWRGRLFKVLSSSTPVLLFHSDLIMCHLSYDVIVMDELCCNLIFFFT